MSNGKNTGDVEALHKKLTIHACHNCRITTKHPWTDMRN